MSRNLPLHVQLSNLSHGAREELAATILKPDAVRDACSKAALQGLNAAVIPLGVARLSTTDAAKALAAAMKGFSFEWVEGVSRDGVTVYELRIGWPIVVA